jgi:hypothetical protein
MPVGCRYLDSGVEPWVPCLSIQCADRPNSSSRQAEDLAVPSVSSRNSWDARMDSTTAMACWKYGSPSSIRPLCTNPIPIMARDREDFDAFVCDFNTNLPHEALKMRARLFLPLRPCPLIHEGGRVAWSRDSAFTPTGLFPGWWAKHPP